MTYIGLVQEYQLRTSTIVYVGNDLDECRAIVESKAGNVANWIEVWENGYNVDMISIF